MQEFTTQAVWELPVLCSNVEEEQQQQNYSQKSQMYISNPVIKQT